MNKPRMRLIEGYWFINGRGVSTYAKTAEMAYWHWRKMLKLKNG